MKLLLRSVQVSDKQSAYNGQIVDIKIKNGIITEIGTDLNVDGDEVPDIAGSMVSVGWFDMRVASRDPGLEHKEDFETLQNAAAKGGFTDIALLPNSTPTVDSKDTLKYVLSRSQLVNLRPMAAVTKKTAGEDFSEMIDLFHAGAIAFTDGEHPIYNADIFLKSLQYLRPLNALLVNKPEDKPLAMFGQMHEGVTSTLLGMKGIPSLAEEIMIARDLKLLEYALSGLPFDASLPLLHFSLISTKESVALIRKAKAKGWPVSCDVAAHQLAFDDTDLMDFDTNLKVSPPFRSAEDRQALLEGLADGTIDTIVSDHNPQEEECKNLEFDMAEFGASAVETVFPVALQYSKLTVEKIVELLTEVPRRILRQPIPIIAIGEPAILTVFNPDEIWNFDKSESKALNNPFLGKELTGKIKGIINHQQYRMF